MGIRGFNRASNARATEKQINSVEGRIGTNREPHRERVCHGP